MNPRHASNAPEPHAEEGEHERGQWVCPRCLATLRYPMALCSPCGRFGNSTALFADGSIERVDADENGRAFRATLQQDHPK